MLARGRGAWGAVLAMLLVVGAYPASATAAEFDPGYIISDGVFYDATTMAAGDVQSFIRSRNAGCRDGYVCLYDYRQTTFDRAADAYCAAYRGAPSELASTIITKVAQACGVNPRSLLVLIQKESSLITHRSPGLDTSYRKATGYGCPDFQPCDAQYYGFYNQVYGAARAFKRYAATASSWRYQAGRVNEIQYHPDIACGSGPVSIRNQATAGLYIYTPYQPNAALLAGRPDSCSSYGNWNFHRIFTEWFGSTSFSLLEAIAPWYRAGTNAQLMGDPIADGFAVAGGLSQRFVNGSVHVSGVGGVQPTTGLMDAMYKGWSGPAGILGFPVSQQSGVAGGLRQDFQHGSLFVSGRAGGVPVLGWMRDIYLVRGGPEGALGFPNGLGRGEAGGLTQSFENGSIMISGVGGVRSVLEPVRATYRAAGGPAGALGFPVAEQVAVPGGVRQDFQNGSVFVATPADGPAAGGAVLGWMRDIYLARGGPSGPLGFPTTAAQRGVAGGLTQAFRNGAVYISGVGGVRVVLGPVEAAYAASGGPAGPLGFPVAEQVAVPGGFRQEFQHGTVFASSAAGGPVAGWIRDIYLARGGPSGPLGFPVAPHRGVAGGLAQAFQNGGLYISGVGGVRQTAVLVERFYTAFGGPAGSLGFPVADQVDVAGGLRQDFQHGSMFVSGRAGGVPVLGWMRDIYLARGGPGGPLGFPTAPGAGVAGGLVQSFEHGSVVISGVGGVRSVLEPVRAAYLREGGPAGWLGFPVAEQVRVGDGVRQDFQNGSITVSGDGVVTVTRRVP